MEKRERKTTKKGTTTHTEPCFAKDAYGQLCQLSRAADVHLPRRDCPNKPCGYEHHRFRATKKRSE